MAVPEEFHDFFVASAGVSGALIGLLFVAASLAPERIVHKAAPAKAQEMAGVAFLVLSNNLFVALSALIPSRTGTPPVAYVAFFAAVTGVVGTLMLAAGSWLERGSDPAAGVGFRWAARLVVTLAVLGIQMWLAVRLESSADANAAITNLTVVTLVFYIMGVHRAWELLGARGHSMSDAFAMYREERQKLAKERAADSAGPS